LISAEYTVIISFRWYWDRNKHECFPFAYFGQGGNFNNFQTKDHCSQFCSADMCPAGLPMRSQSGTLLSCSSFDQCPPTHTCYHGRCCPKPGLFT
ncbi:Kunitz/Bovine pancreatic trypsin inhibitor domain protein, partial [Cooperia oncophora]